MGAEASAVVIATLSIASAAVAWVVLGIDFTAVRSVAVAIGETRQAGGELAGSGSTGGIAVGEGAGDTASTAIIESGYIGFAAVVGVAIAIRPSGGTDGVAHTLAAGGVAVRIRAGNAASTAIALIPKNFGFASVGRRRIAVDVSRSTSKELARSGCTAFRSIGVITGLPTASAIGGGCQGGFATGGGAAITASPERVATRCAVAA